MNDVNGLSFVDIERRAQPLIDRTEYVWNINNALFHPLVCTKNV